MSEPQRFKVVGKPRRRVDGRAKVTGQTRFADDIVMPRMVHARILRSPLPHAEIESIDARRASALPGVHLVLTGDDFPVTFGMMPVSQDEYPLARGRVRYVGDPVAAVIAKDEQTAGEALDLIEVKYRPLATIASAEDALRTPAPKIHDYTDHGNIHRVQSYEFGDVADALAKSDHVFDDLFFYQGNTHLPMEQQASLASLEGDGKLLLQSSTQNPHYLHRQMARVLQVPQSQIRVVAVQNGGGFGGKCDPANHEMVVAKAAHRVWVSGWTLTLPSSRRRRKVRRGTIFALQIFSPRNRAPWPRKTMCMAACVTLRRCTQRRVCSSKWHPTSPR